MGRLLFPKRFSVRVPKMSLMSSLEISSQIRPCFVCVRILPCLFRGIVALLSNDELKSSFRGG